MVTTSDHLYKEISNYFRSIDCASGICIELNKEEQSAVFGTIYCLYNAYIEHYSVRVKEYDSYKIAAWMPYAIDNAKELTDEQRMILVVTSSNILEEDLKAHGKRISSEWSSKIKNMAFHGMGDHCLEPISIGRNGLYTTYKMARVCETDSRSMGDWVKISLEIAKVIIKETIKNNTGLDFKTQS